MVLSPLLPDRATQPPPRRSTRRSVWQYAFPKLSPLRRRLVIVATTLLCLAATDLLVRSGDEHLSGFYLNRYQRKLAVLSRLDPKPEIVLMGSSRAKYALVPEEFRNVTHLAAFNLGIPASKVIEWRHLAEEMIRLAKPKLIVLGVNASAVRADYLPVPAARELFTLNDFLDYCRSDGWSGEVAMHFLERNAGKAWALYHRRFEIKMFLQAQAGGILPKHAQEALEHRAMVSTRCPPDGYEHPWLYGRRLRHLQAQLDTEGDAVWAAAVPAFAPDAGAIGHLGKLLVWIKGQGIAVIVAYIPNSPRTEKRWIAMEPRMIEEIAAVCRRSRVPFVSCAQGEFPRANADYLEELHVGLPLARRLSRRIAQRARDLGMLEQGAPGLAHVPEEDATLP